MAGAATGILELSYQANEALTKHRFVKVSADQKVDQCDTAGEEALGVNPTNVSAAEADKKTVRVTVHGVVWVEAGSGGLTRLDDVATDNAGKGVTAGSGDVILGKCLRGAAEGALALVGLSGFSHTTA